jgi:hypothetical protein
MFSPRTSSAKGGKKKAQQGGEREVQKGGDKEHSELPHKGTLIREQVYV